MYITNRKTYLTKLNLEQLLPDGGLAGGGGVGGGGEGAVPVAIVGVASFLAYGLLVEELPAGRVDLPRVRQHPRRAHVLPDHGALRA